MKNKLGFLGIAGAVLAGIGNTRESHLDRIARMVEQDETDLILDPGEPRKLPQVIIQQPVKQKPIPKGCKEYHFNINGGFAYFENGEYSEKIKLVDIVFTCVALNTKSAKKKFNTWKGNNT